MPGFVFAAVALAHAGTPIAIIEAKTGTAIASVTSEPLSGALFSLDVPSGYLLTP